MDFSMEIDHRRKRRREEAEQGDRIAKKARQLDADRDAPAIDSIPPSPSPSESDPSTPASIDVEMDDISYAPKPTPQAQPRPQVQSQSQSRGTVISGWNQTRRDHYLRQGYPLSWMSASKQVSVFCSSVQLVASMLTMRSELVIRRGLMTQEEIARKYNK
ncbi:hypothetical protein N658DRAFT_10747 [Parathielavia hyrcaniae]|uniref:Uncharacterized protein n=1 Tax=Parathielavia hyrcaniae TaxID=113614 RepID=A0AAN6T5R9_9PEZI|nr:hypothetical protein N658DRAFT_10747 [Parathielavia hyrcaniae]